MIHCMSSCQGELPDEEFDVKAVDQEGRVLYDGKIRTIRNGFFDYGCPMVRRSNRLSDTGSIHQSAVSAPLTTAKPA